MDRSLDDVISERRAPPRGPRGGGRFDNRRGPPRDPPRDSYAPRDNHAPRDSYRKPREDIRDPEDEWVHDRFEGDRITRRDPRARPAAVDRYEPNADSHAETSAKLRVDNLHYDLTEADLKDLFAQQGAIIRLEIVYDRADRSTGQAYVTYESSRDADRAIREYDGARAMGQHIKVTRVPTGPSAKGRGFGAKIEAPVGRTRSLFERVERRRSESPRRSDVRDAPEGIDRYVPRDRSDRPPPRRRSPRSRSPPRRGGRGGRGDRRGRGTGRIDSEGRSLVGGRPRRTANELDAEMDDYWGSKDGAVDGIGPAVNGQATDSVAQTNPPEPAPQEDIDMIL